MPDTKQGYDSQCAVLAEHFLLDHFIEEPDPLLVDDLAIAVQQVVEAWLAEKGFE